ncbi:MAG: helix-turn-helix domain-containing protein [Sphingopyxis sp.]
MLRSRNYAPSAALDRYIARHYVFSVDAPDDFELIDQLLSETAFIRILLKGDWSAEIAPGTWSNVGPTVFFGPNSKPLKVRVRGGFTVVGIAICPAGWRALIDAPASDYTDRMLPLDALWGEAAGQLHAAISALDGDDDQAIVATIEQFFSEHLSARDWLPPSSAMQAFELIARNQSTTVISDAASQIGLSTRQMERQCKVHFGMSPKAILARSRFLDTALAIRGLSQPSEEQLASLRYYDQSHQNREFRRFIGMTPRQFEQTPTPLLTAGLDLRNLRKAEKAEG